VRLDHIAAVYANGSVRFGNTVAGIAMNNDGADDPSQTTAGLPAAATNLPTLSEKIGEWLGFQLPGLPPMPQTLKNLDKAGAALIDWPTAAWESKAAGIRAKASRGDALEQSVTDAMRRELSQESNKQIAGHVRGLIRDYLQKHHSRKRVLELAIKEVAADPGQADATGEPNDDFMAFFKGKVDALGTEEARVLFAKVLAGEVKRPGSFSKPAMTILAEMDSEVGHLFEILCNMSVAAPGVRSWAPRVLTLGLDEAHAGNALRPLGLGFGQLNILNEAGLIISDYNSYAMGIPVPFDLAGDIHSIVVTGDQKVLEATFQRMHGIVFTKSGGELRGIVSMTPNQAYVTRLRAEFLKVGAAMS
jgi:Protein of unknown function (DUF2806)